VRSEEAHVGTRVRGGHRVESQRGAVGQIIGRYGGREHVAVEAWLSDSRRRLFWPGDLKEATPSRLWWRSVFERS
jgi:hypothetical protein